jgi:methanogenic corrinoid protein MtbC1
MQVSILEGLERAIREYDSEQAADRARQSVAEGVDPLQCLDVIAAVMSDIGKKFEAGECWLPDMVGAADAVQATMPILEEEIKRSGAETRSLGTVVAGTVKGDIHSIGIQTVCTLLIGAGFGVHYLGIDIAPEQFVTAVRETKADLLAMSALLTVTASEQKKTIHLLAAEGLRESVKVMVGGGAVTEDFALRIGADGYGASAPSAVELAKRLAAAPEEVGR